jgi:hypothetical protein
MQHFSWKGSIFGTFLRKTKPHYNIAISFKLGLVVREEIGRDYKDKDPQH